MPDQAIEPSSDTPRTATSSQSGSSSSTSKEDSNEHFLSQLKEPRRLQRAKTILKDRLHKQLS